MRLRNLIIALTVLFIIGCAIRKNLETPFDPKNKPVIDDGGDKEDKGGGDNNDKDAPNPTRFCAPDSNGNFDSSAITETKAGMNGDGSAWHEAGGCVSRPIREVWAVLHNLDVMQWRETDSYTFVRTVKPKDDFTHLNEVTYYKSTIIGQIEWTTQWYHGFDRGTFESPLGVNILYQRVRGTSNIPIWNGGVVLSKVTDKITSIAIRNVFKARQSESENQASSRDTVHELIDKLRQGRADWQRLNEGLTDKPTEPPPPPPPGETQFCKRDQHGRYPSEPQTTLDQDNGVSIVQIHACLTRSADSVFITTKNHRAIRWKNATSSTPGALDGQTQRVAYEISRWFRPPIRWDMEWNYHATDNIYVAEYKIDPATANFPTWNGSIQLKMIEAGVTEMVVKNRLLTDSARQSLEQNRALTTSLFNELVR